MNNLTFSSSLEANELRRVASEIRDNQRKTRSLFRAKSNTNQTNDHAVDQPVKQSLVSPCPPTTNGNFVIQPKDIKVNQDKEKEEWEITIKISRNDEKIQNQNQTIRKTVSMNSKITKPVTESSTQTNCKTLKTEKSEQPISESTEPPIMCSKEQRVSRSREPSNDQPVVVKWEQPPKAPVIKTSDDRPIFSGRPPLANRFVPDKIGFTGSITRKDVLPDLPTRERPRFSSRRENEPNKFKNILNKWEDRINLLRA